MPPTPQHHYSHMPSHASPSQSASQPNGVPSYHHGYNVSFDASGQQSFSQPAPSPYAQSFPNGPVSNPGYARSFGSQSMRGGMRGYNEEPQIYTAVYSGVSVYEMEIGGVAVMRRRSDGWLNATQILKVAGVDKGKRTKVLEKEILTGEHEKVQGGYGKYQGTWISYRRGLEFCRQYGVEDILRPLLEYDISADGTSANQGQDTPTKEQAMAAQRKRFYTNSSLDPRANGVPGSNGTFFSNISPTTSMALAAMNKAARLNSPQRTTPKPSNMRRQSQQDGFNGGSQQSQASGGDTKAIESTGNIHDAGEPPRKRMRPSSQEGMGPPDLPLDASMRSATPTEPNESFLYENALMADSVNNNGEPVALAPLPSPATDEQQEKMNLILDLFAEQGRTDYASHRALRELSNEDLNMPLDASANNALHWAATLAKVPLLRLLIQRGASIWRGNAAGHSPLISAVLVNNSWEHSCFPEILELLGPLIEVRDLRGMTILHHIAVSSGIKGRAPSSKYYLEALLEFLVRIGTQQNTSTPAQSAAKLANAAANLPQPPDAESTSQENGARGPVNLSRFLSHIVNARDKAGNTALNLVARIGNRSIIQQLLEIHADPSLPNNKGVSARDFGVGVEPGERQHTNGGLSSQQSTQTTETIAHSQALPNREAMMNGSGSQAELMGQEVIASMTSMFTQNIASHKEFLRTKTEEIDRINEEIRELSARQQAEHDQLQEARERVRLRSERQAKAANLRRAIDQKRAALAQSKSRRSNSNTSPVDLHPEWMSELPEDVFDTPQGQSTVRDRELVAGKLPSLQQLRARVNAYSTSNSGIQLNAEQLRAKSTELEAMYRKVVALCTGVAEDKVEESLPALVAAVESEQGGIGEQEVGRVREFLRRVDGSRREPDLMINPTVTAAAERAAAARAAADARGPASVQTGLTR